MSDLFDKVKKGMTKGVAATGIKSKEILGVSGLKMQISTFRKQKQKAIEKLGNDVYTMFLKKSINEGRIKDIGAAIFKLDNQIKDLESEIDQVHNKARKSFVALSIGKCTCGALIDENAKFCRACGKKVAGSSTVNP